MSLVSIVGALARLLQDQTRLYRLQGPAELAPLLVETFALQSAVNQPWRLDVGCVAADAALALDDVLGQPVSLLTRLADGGEHQHTGLLLGLHYGDTDGTLARYRLQLGPWLSLLAHTQRSQVWQERSVVDILDSVFAHYPAAAWRWAPCVAPHLAQSPQGADGLRSLCTQYRETDLAFVQRLLTEEGLNYRFEPDGTAPAGHTLVIFADSSSADACPEDVCSLLNGGVAYHRAESVEARDAIQAFGGSRQLPVAETVALAWDYRAKSAVAGSTPTASRYGGPHAARLQAFDAAGAYAFGSSTAAQRATELQQQAHEARAKRWLGRSTVRSFSPGQRFTLGSSMLDALDALTSTTPDRKTFLLTQVHAAGVNNLPKDLARSIHQALGQGWRPPATGPWEAGPDQLPQWLPPELRQQAHERGYANQFEASRIAIPWRPQLQDGSGA
uniref:type VI secretion system Vgr family protein n=1 Tax=Ideonella sp. TaxID=1929293 RepID=UPI0037C19717